jgi:hypothetical protein
MKEIGTLFGARIYTDEGDQERINLILDYLKKKEKEAAKLEIEQMLSKFTRN